MMCVGYLKTFYKLRDFLDFFKYKLTKIYSVASGESRTFQWAIIHSSPVFNNRKSKSWRRVETEKKEMSQTLSFTLLFIFVKYFIMINIVLYRMLLHKYVGL